MLNENELMTQKYELIRIARRAFERGLQTGTGGNLSVRLATQAAFLIKPSGVGFAECNPNNLLVVNPEGAILSGTGKPSKDMSFHLGIYRARPDINAIMHVHSPWATGWASGNKQIPCLTIHARAKLGQIPMVPLGPDNGNQLPEAIVAVFKDARVRACLLEQHGAVAVGGSLLKAQQLAELIEETAQIAAVAAMIAVAQ